MNSAIMARPGLHITTIPDWAAHFTHGPPFIGATTAAGIALNPDILEIHSPVPEMAEAARYLPYQILPGLRPVAAAAVAEGVAAAVAEEAGPAVTTTSTSRTGIPPAR